MHIVENSVCSKYLDMRISLTFFFFFFTKWKVLNLTFQVKLMSCNYLRHTAGKHLFLLVVMKNKRLVHYTVLSVWLLGFFFLLNKKIGHKSYSVSNIFFHTVTTSG